MPFSYRTPAGDRPSCQHNRGRSGPRIACGPASALGALTRHNPVAPRSNRLGRDLHTLWADAYVEEDGCRISPHPDPTTVRIAWSIGSSNAHP
jgi:hypothetical protein